MRIHKITRRNFMKVAGVSALAMGLAACGGSSSSTAASTSTAGSAAGGEVTGDKVVINIGHINDESDSWHQGALKFKEYCEANSNGTIEVDVFPNSQLGPEVDMIQGILSDSGTVDITFTGESMQTYQPDLGMIGMPYLIQSDEQMEKVLTGEVGQEFEGLMEACGMKCLGYFTRGPRYITSTKKITSVADCNNLVIRTPQSAMTVAAFQALGAKPTPMALSEVFTSLQQGTIEAQENPPLPDPDRSSACMGLHRNGAGPVQSSVRQPEGRCGSGWCRVPGIRARAVPGQRGKVLQPAAGAGHGVHRGRYSGVC